MVSALKTTGSTSDYLGGVLDQVLFYAKSREVLKYRNLFHFKEIGQSGTTQYKLASDRNTGLFRRLDRGELAGASPADGWSIFAPDNLTSQRPPGEFQFAVQGKTYTKGKGFWKTHEAGFVRLRNATRIHPIGNTLMYRRYLDDFPVSPVSNLWRDVLMTGFSEEKTYVVQSSSKIVERCLLMTTDPGDLVLDPTCGSGTTAFVAEQWGRRWITIDTSRVALALARARIMGAKYPFYFLADSPEGRAKEAEITRTPPPDTPTHGDIRQGFVYERVPHITLKSIANNAEIDVIWERMQPAVEDARAALNAALASHATPFKIATGGRAGQSLDFRRTGEVTLPSGEPAPVGGLMDWEVPREAPSDWPEAARAPLAAFWQARIARQREIDASIAARAEFEYLYDKPYEDKKRSRVAGPFTVETLSPHRTPAIGPDGEMILDDAPRGPGDALADAPEAERDAFFRAILENLKKAGVHQQAKGDRIAFTTVTPWPGRYIGAEGRYLEGETDPPVERRAAILVGPEYGTVQRADLVMAAREAQEAGFDLLIAFAFNYDAHADLDRMGPLPILRARMNPDLHMAGELKAGGGNLFVVFGEPDVALHRAGDALRIEIRGVDVFRPQTGEIDSVGPEGIACWFVDTDYSGESFFVRQAYFLGAGDPYKSLRTTLRDEIDEDAWASLNSAVSRPFPRPAGGKVAVKAINHLGDEVMRVFDV
jgi:adenine-specific DNA-methyltransferase